MHACILYIKKVKQACNQSGWPGAHSLTPPDFFLSADPILPRGSYGPVGFYCQDSLAWELVAGNRCDLYLLWSRNKFSIGSLYSGMTSLVLKKF